MTDPFATPATNEDPWAAEEAKATPPPAQAKARPDAVTADGKVVITIKGGKEFDSPWIVVHAADAEDGLSQLDSTMAKLMEKVADVARFFKGKVGGGAAPQQRPQNNNQGGQPGRPDTADQAPNGEKKYCRHGEMKWKSGISKAGNAYSMWACTSRDRDDQCDPVWPPKKR